MIAVKDGFFRVAAATPAVSVADVEENLERIEELVRQAAADGCGAVCFPELALTAYTCGDLFRDEALLSAAESGPCPPDGGDQGLGYPLRGGPARALGGSPVQLRGRVPQGEAAGLACQDAHSQLF